MMLAPLWLDTSFTTNLARVMEIVAGIRNFYLLIGEIILIKQNFVLYCIEKCMADIPKGKKNLIKQNFLLYRKVYG